MKHHRIEIPVKRAKTKPRLIRGHQLVLYFFDGTCSTQGLVGKGPTPLTAMSDLVHQLYLNPGRRAGKLVLR